MGADIERGELAALEFRKCGGGDHGGVVGGESGGGEMDRVGEVGGAGGGAESGIAGDSAGDDQAAGADAIRPRRRRG